jgi:ABC-type antimicrobial peptide transport system permease subunit
VFLYVGIGFAVFSAFLLLTFIATSISYKKREIGILRAVGARGGDVFGIFLNESMIIVLISFVISFIGVLIGAFLLNRMLQTEMGVILTLLTVGIRQFALMLGVNVLVAFAATFLPTFSVSRKKPIDTLRTA